MKKLSRALVLLASVLLGATFLFPLWKFEIWAPQYPEGLFMYVWTTKITGDVNNINILNHYVGMNPIRAEDMFELVVFPWLFGSLMVTGLATAWLAKRRVFFTWAVAFIVFCTASLVDFYIWEKKFGTELREDAAIKMEETYQPPLIGMKQMMNITAWSLPDIAGYALTAAVALTTAAIGVEVLNRKRATTLAVAVACGLSLVNLPGCLSNGPEKIEIGKDACDECKMVVSDVKFGGELVTSKGKVYKFDAIECMTSYLKSHPDQGTPKLYVPDAANGGDLIPAETAVYTIDESKRGPMGKYILASASSANLKGIAGNEAKEVLKWNELLERLPNHAH